MHEIVRGRRVVEFGALLGFSSIVLAREAAHVVSIDRHEGYGPSTLKAYLSNLHRYGVLEKVTPLIGQADLLSPTMQGDVAFVDLTGTYDLTKRVIEPLQTPLLLVHDFQRPHCEVGRAVIDAGWTPIQQVDSLLLCERTTRGLQIHRRDGKSPT